MTVSLGITYLSISVLRNNDLDLGLDEEEDLDEGEENALLRYCFEDIYGPNFGFRTLVEFDEVCEEVTAGEAPTPGVRQCGNDTDILPEDNLSPIEGDGQDLLAEERGKLAFSKLLS